MVIFAKFFVVTVFLTIHSAQIWADSLELFFTANRQGEIEPCGCQTGQIGGLGRMYQFLQGQKSIQPRLFADSGDTFFATETLLPFRKNEQIAKARLIAQSYREMGLNYFTPGDRDFAGGVAFLNELRKLSGATFLSANIQDQKGEWLFQRFQIVELQSFHYGVLALADPQALSRVKEIRLLPVESTLKTTVSEMRKQGAKYIVLLSHLGLDKDIDLAKLGLVDVILGSHSMDVTSDPKLVGKTWIVQPNIEGQQIGHLTYRPPPKQISFRLVELDTQYDSDNKVKKLMKAYYEQLRSIAKEKPDAKLRKRKVRPFVAQAFKCKQCHQTQYKWWEKTKHASAYLVLYSKNQHFNPECIGCHSLGFEDPRGFQKIARPITLKRSKSKEIFVEKLMESVFKGDKGPLDSRRQPKRYQKLKKRYHKKLNRLASRDRIQALHMGVQCEHCHGIRAGHPGSATQKKVVASSCVTCHSPPNDSAFNFKADRKEIACPLL